MDDFKKLYNIVNQMRKTKLLDHAKRTFPPGTPRASFMFELVAEGIRIAKRVGSGNRVWNVNSGVLKRAAEQIYPLWLEWSDEDETQL